MYILFDIGGTNMRLAASRDGKRLGKIKIVPTPSDFNDGIKKFREIALELSDSRKIKGIAGGIAGPVDRKKSKLLNSPNIPGWIGKPLKKNLEKIFKCPVYIENDSAIVGLGEATHGAGKGFKIVTYITISTGVGGARIVSGKIDERAIGFEPGHQIIDPTGAKCPSCRVPGHLEGLISGGAIGKRFGKIATDIKDKKVWEETAKYLAMGLNNTIVHWSPDVVVLGGPMMKSIPLPRVKHHLKKLLRIYPEIPTIKRARLKNIGGLYGALNLIKQKR